MDDKLVLYTIHTDFTGNPMIPHLHSPLCAWPQSLAVV